MRKKTSEKGVYKEQNGTYTIDTSFRGRRISKRGFLKLSDAKKFKSDAVSSLDFSKNTRQKAKFEDLIKIFSEKHLPRIRESTHERYMLDIERRIVPFFQFMYLEDINPAMIERFQTYLVKEGRLSNKSINNCLGTLHTMFKKAEFWGFVEKSPMRIERLPVNQGSVKNWWDNRQHIDRFVDGLLNAKYEPYRAAFLLALECGLRLGEIVALSPEDINLDLRHVNVTKSWNDKLHKMGPTKSGKSRLIKFSHESHLNSWLSTAMERAENKQILFQTRTGRRVIGRKISSEVFKKWKTNLDLPEITFHGLRHTFASWYMIRGGRIWDLYKIMGHSDFKTTVKLYAHLSPDAASVPSWGSEQ